MSGGPELIHAAQEVFLNMFIAQYAGAGGKFRPYATTPDMQSAETATWHYTGKSTSRRHPGGHSPVTSSGIRHVKISATLEDWYDFEPAGAFELAKTQGPAKRMQIAKALVQGMGRREDQNCLNSLINATYSGTVVGSGGNTIATGSARLTFEKHEEALEYFTSREVDLEDIVYACSEQEVRNIHHDASFASLDFRRSGIARPTKAADLANELGIGGVIVLGSQAYVGEGGLPVAANVRDTFYYDKNRLGLCTLELPDTEGAALAEAMKGCTTGVGWSIERLATIAWVLWSGAAKFVADPDDTDSEGVVKVEIDTTAAQPS